MITVEHVVGVCGLGAAFSLGGIYGLHLAWSQQARMGKWAAKYADLYERATKGN